MKETHTNTDEIILVPYRQEGEPPRQAAVIRAMFATEGLSDRDFQVLGHLAEAAESINPIFRDQFEPATARIRRLVQSLIGAADREERTALENYAVMLDLQNSPYSQMPRKNCLVGLPLERLRELAERAGSGAVEDLSACGALMTLGFPTPDRANFYPPDFSDEEFERLGEMRTTVNSSVLRDAEGTPFAVLNEDRYAEALEPVIEHLTAARNLTGNTSFRLYLDAKIMELQTGTEEARRVADYLWIRHTSPIDIVISTALEVYVDRFKNARGSAAAAVLVDDPAASRMLEEIVKRVPEWERTAPWTNRKETVDPSALPKLKFVNVLTWAGDYVNAPLITLAQSLPNDEWVGANVGTVNMVFGNTGLATHKVSGLLGAERLFTPHDFNRFRDLLFEANRLHSALHEIGHTTGLMDEAHRTGQPRDYFGAEYSMLEETRAELFGLWAQELLVRDGVITDEKLEAGYMDMLLTMVMALRFDPVQAHTAARNWIFHVWREAGAVREERLDGETRFSVEFAAARTAVTGMLATVGDLKASGNLDEVKRLTERYVYPDPLKEELERRTSDFPLGRGVIFPRLKKTGDRYTAELEYPERFTDQAKFTLPLKSSF